MRKVGENMADKEIIEKLADECGGIFRTSDLAALGYNTYAIRKMVDEQIIERIKCVFPYFQAILFSVLD